MWSWKFILKLSLVLVGILIVLMGVASLLAQPPAQCIVILIFPIGCYTPNAFGWVGGLITAILGLAVVWLGLRVA